jgi:hypothetical protein
MTNLANNFALRTSLFSNKDLAKHLSCMQLKYERWDYRDRCSKNMKGQFHIKRTK